MSKGYRGFASKQEYQDHYSDPAKYAAEIPAMEEYTREANMKKSDAPAPTPGGWGDRVQLEPEEAMMNREEMLALADRIERSTGLICMLPGQGNMQLGIKATAQIIAALRAAPAPPEINHFEDTPAGRIDWKMEAERANRLLAASERAAAARLAATVRSFKHRPDGGEE